MTIAGRTAIKGVVVHRWVVCVGLVLLVMGLGWQVLRVTLLSGPDRTDVSRYGRFVLAAVGLVLAVLPLLRD